MGYPLCVSTFAENRKARHDYETIEKFDGGLSLLGHEVKSVREGGAKLTGSYITLKKGEVWLVGCRIAPYSKAGKLDGYDPIRDRKILVTKKELEEFFGKTIQKGLTLVPFSLYARGRHIKVHFGLCRGRQAHDKREALKRKDVDRDIRRETGI